ncbi:MAG: 8-amino-7-oxononanoate synthase [Kribbellaceae bacterium]
MSLDDWLAGQAADREAQGLTRRLRPREAARPGTDAPIDLAGNDYLGLATDPRIADAAATAVRTWGAGATGSRLVSGTTRLHAELEEALADFCRQPAALVFSSGYLANLGVVTALAGPGTLLVSDAHVHASLVDACRLARSRVEIVPHNDVDAVERALAGREEPRALVLAESVYSVLGDAAPLDRLAQVCAERDAVLLVDEAHGVGVTGAGRGSVAAAGLAGAEHVVVTVTLSKALGAQGGAVLGSARLQQHLVNRARTFIFDTGLAPAATAAALAAVDVVRAEPDRVVAVHTVADRLARAAGVLPVPGAVLSVPVPGPREAVAAAKTCAAHGVRVGAFRPPSVPDGVSRLRITARATLAGDALDRACEVLEHAVESVR